MDKVTLTHEQAIFLRALRVDMGCSWGRIDELFQQYYPGITPNTGSEVGRVLCGLAEEVLGETDWDSPEWESYMGRQILHLQRPISVVDVETTGTDTNSDRICSISITRINEDLSMQTAYSLINPEVPIPDAAIKIHGITNDMVKDADTFKDKAHRIATLIKDTDIVTFNGLRFDIPLLIQEFARAGYSWDYTKHSFPDAFRIFQHFHPRNLSAAHQEYLGYEMQNAHRADADTEATALIFLKMLQVHQDLPLNMDDLQMFLNDGKPMADFSGRFKFNDEGKAYYNFGKHKGKTVEDVTHIEPTYSAWILTSDFPEDSKKFLSHLLLHNNK